MERPMASLRELGERALIENLHGIVRPMPGAGVWDDAAVLDLQGTAVVCTDTVSVERHKPAGMTWEQFGWTAAAVSLSDIASMGARPVGVLVALQLDGDMDERDAYDLMSGMDQCAEFCGTYLVGGDTKPGHGSVTATVIGSTDGRPPLRRSGASPGDLVGVTGRLGSAAAGYHALMNGIDEEDATMSLLVPVPRVEEGSILLRSGAVTSCMDLSDGLAEAAHAICAASGVGMDIRKEFLPVEPHVDAIADRLGLDRDGLVMYWGGDYELLFTFDKRGLARLHGEGLDFSIVGTVIEGDAPCISDGDGRKVMDRGEY